MEPIVTFLCNFTIYYFLLYLGNLHVSHRGFTGKDSICL